MCVCGGGGGGSQLPGLRIVSEHCHLTEMASCHTERCAVKQLRLEKNTCFLRVASKSSPLWEQPCHWLLWASVGRM